MFLKWLSGRMVPNTSQLFLCELAFRLATLDTSAETACKASGLLDFAIHFEIGRDVLGSVGLIELFLEVGGSKKGYAVLKSTGVLEKMATLTDQPCFDKFLICAIVKFWGTLEYSKRYGRVQEWGKT